MYSLEYLEKEDEKIVEANKTKAGDLMIVVEECSIKGNILLHTYDRLVSLNNPESVWSVKCPFYVKILTKGKIVFNIH